MKNVKDINIEEFNNKTNIQKYRLYVNEQKKNIAFCQKFKLIKSTPHKT